MGVYSNNRLVFSEGYASEVEAPEPDTRYYGNDGASRILAEAATNDLKMFEAIIGNDMQQAYVENAINEGADLEDKLMALQEAATGGIFSKLKEFLKKIWEKITGLIMSFVRKIQGAVTSDNKKLVDKFKKSITTNSTKLKKMKFKFSKPTGNAYKKPLTPDAINGEISDKTDEIFGMGQDIANLTVGSSWGDDWAGSKGEYIQDSIAKARIALEKELDKDDWEDKALSDFIGSTTVNDFVKDAHEFFFEDEDELDGEFGKYQTYFMSTLTNAKTTTDNLDKSKREIDKHFSKAIKDAEKFGNAAIKLVGKKDTSSDASDFKHRSASGKSTTAFSKSAMTDDTNDELNKAASGITTAAAEFSKAANAIQRWYTAYQGVCTKLMNAQMAAASFEIKQARRIWTQAASFVERPVKEDALLFDAIGEAADFETDQLINY